MKSVVCAGIAGLLISSTGMAQEDWSFIVCQYETHFTVQDPSGIEDGGRTSVRQTYRFNPASFDRYAAGPVSWVSLCTPDDDFPIADCVINADSVISRRSGRPNSTSGATVRYDITINRVTGRYSDIHITELPSTQTIFRHEGSGACEPASDPTGGVRRF